MQKFIQFFTLVLVIFAGCIGNKPLFDKSIEEQSVCEEKDGYWYKEKCWLNFKDEGIAVADIDKTVDEQMILIAKEKINVNSTTHPITFFMPEIDGKEVIFITIFEDEIGAKTILQPTKINQVKSGIFSSPALLLNGNLVEISEDEVALEKVFKNLIAKGELETTVHNFDELDITFKGVLNSEKTGKSFNINYQTNEVILSAGTSTLEVKNNEIHINGELGTRTYHQLKKAIQDYPNAKMVVLGKINGSLNDAVNMHTGRILREAGLTTKVLKDSDIASGGVDLFCAGLERIVEKGAKIGIHSWCCFNELTAIELPKEHPAHKYQIEYFTMCLGEEIGPNFYFHTLSAAPFEGMYWMSDEEIKKWTVATEFID